MARHRADQPEDDAAEDSRAEDQVSETSDEDTVADDETADDEDAASEDSDSSGRSAKVDAFWEQVKVEPVEIALPRGVGYTLRAYRMSDTLEADEPEPDDLVDDEPDAAADAEDDADEDAEETRPRRGKSSVAASSSSRRRRVDAKADEDDEDEREDDDDRDEDEPEDDDRDDQDQDDEDSEDEEDEDEDEEEDDEPEPEEVPVFLTQDRRLLLFRSPEGLAAFVRSGEATSMQDLDEWDDLSKTIAAEHVVASDDDRYELDLVVENLRGGQDAWDAELIIKAGELCRDLGYALRIESVISALSAGSPLDDLDEALRSVASGGIGGFFARRKLRRIGAQQAALAWRSIIGKISTSVDWRD